MSEESLRLLLVEDSVEDAELIAREIRKSGRPSEIVRVENEAQMRAALASRTWDAIIVDWSLPTFSATAAAAVFRELALDVPFIVASGTVTDESACEALRAGADDFFLKDRLSRLVPAIDRARRDRLARRKAEEALRRSDEQLRRVQKLEALGVLAGGVAHDFNNLLAVILSYASHMLDELSPGDPLRADVEEVQRAGERAQELTRRLLAFGRKETLRPRIVDLNAVVTGIERMLRRLLGSGIKLTIVLGDALGAVEADPSQLELVLMNLVVNARDAMPLGGTITVTTANIDGEGVGGGADPGGYVTLTVTDTGAGMDAVTQARIFEPFFTTKEQGKGTGLGLSTVFGIVEQSGGHIEVKSELGRGSTFELFLPRHEPP